MTLSGIRLLFVVCIGSINIHSNGAGSSVKLKDVLLAPQITKNLISVSRLTNDNEVSVEFDKNQCVVKDKTGNKLLGAIQKEGLSQNLVVTVFQSAAVIVVQQKRNGIVIWDIPLKKYFVKCLRIVMSKLFLMIFYLFVMLVKWENPMLFLLNNLIPMPKTF